MKPKSLSTWLRKNRFTRAESHLKTLRGEERQTQIQNAIKDACLEGRDPALRFLQEIGISLLENGSQTLCSAATGGSPKCILYLLSLGIAADSENNAPILCAARQGHTNAISLLTEHGANPLTHNSEALKLACQNGHLKTAKSLIEWGADIHTENEAPLRLSAEKGHTPIVAHLLTLGANPKVLDHYALIWAIEDNHLETTNLLLSHYSTKELKSFVQDPRNNETKFKEILENELTKRTRLASLKVQQNLPELEP